MLLGCAPKYDIKYDKVFFTAELVDELPDNIQGFAQCYYGNVCHIKILKDKYPRCLVHEIRHGFEGNWHEGYNTTWDCD